MLFCSCTDKPGHQNAMCKQSLEQFAASSQACQLHYYWPHHIPAGSSRSPAADSSWPWRSSPALEVQPSPGVHRASSAFPSGTYRQIMSPGHITVSSCKASGNFTSPGLLQDVNMPDPKLPVLNLNSPFAR